jgi:hypothetical protein
VEVLAVAAHKVIATFITAFCKLLDGNSSAGSVAG